MRAMLQGGWSVTAAGIGQFAAPVLTDAESSAISWTTMDVTDQSQVRDTMNACRPDMVLHLAAISHVPDARANPGLAYEVNVVGSVRVLAEARRLRDEDAADPTVLVIGSAEQYGRHEITEMPLHGEWEHRPRTP